MKKLQSQEKLALACSLLLGSVLVQAQGIETAEFARVAPNAQAEIRSAVPGTVARDRRQVVEEDVRGGAANPARRRYNAAQDVREDLGSQARRRYNAAQEVREPVREAVREQARIRPDVRGEVVGNIRDSAGADVRTNVRSGVAAAATR